MRLSLFLISMVILLFFCSLLTGHTQSSVVTSLKALISGEGPLGTVMQEIRLPRAILAVLIGGSLGLCGAAMQGYLRNPLAEPGLIGISGAAALGAVLSLQTGFAAAFWLALPLSALGMSFFSVLLIMLLAGKQGRSLTLILAGIAISALAGAMLSLVLNLSPNPYATAEIVFWMMGSLADRSFNHVWLALPFCVVGSVMLLSIGPALNALTLGEDTAQTMGISLVNTRYILVIGVAAMIGATTAVAGAVGFVGLVVPHILRRWVKSQPSRLMWASMLGGAALVLAADILVRVVLPDRDLKLGVVMAILGAPLFLHLIYKTRAELS
ncbi:MAG: ABC transporter permease [Marinovum sp.]|nr:ABC transporter permease [Marinovum sp.]